MYLRSRSFPSKDVGAVFRGDFLFYLIFFTNPPSHSRNVTEFNNTHDWTEKPSSVYLWRQPKPAATRADTPAHGAWLAAVVNGREPRNVVCAVLSGSVITAQQASSTFLRLKHWTALFLEAGPRVFLIRAQTSATLYFSRIKTCSELSFTQRSPAAADLLSGRSPPTADSYLHTLVTRQGYGRRLDDILMGLADGFRTARALWRDWWNQTFVKLQRLISQDKCFLGFKPSKSSWQ